MILNIFEFTEEDLKSNRLGLLSANQRKWVEGMAGGIRRSQRSLFPVLIFFMILGLGLFLGMTLSNESTRKAFLADPSTLIVLCGSVLVILGIFGASIFFANRRAERLANSQVARAEGKVRLDEKRSSKTGTTYYAIIGRDKFAFAESVSGLFKEGEAYRIYYCETSMLKLILSYERIS
jgi:hypothetical protein